MKLKWIVLTLALLALPYSLAFSQDEATTHWLLGVEYDTEAGFHSSAGIAMKGPLSVWVVGRTTIGRYGSTSADLIYFPTSLGIGLIVGPMYTWQDLQQEGPMSYVVGASGVVLTKKWESWGLNAGAKYLFGPDGFQDGWQGGLFLTFPFK